MVSRSCLWTEPFARRGFVDAVPLFIPAVPFGLVLGLAITESGIGALVGWSSSPIIFGGSAQLTLVSLLGSAAPQWSRPPRPRSWSTPAI